jgi:hypothetical protein
MDLGAVLELQISVQKLHPNRRDPRRKQQSLGTTLHLKALPTIGSGGDALFPPPF